MLKKTVIGLILLAIMIGGCSTDVSEEMDLRVVAKAGDIDFTMYDLDCYTMRMNYKSPEDELFKKTDFLDTYMERLVAANEGLKLGYLDSVEVDSGQVSRILYEIVYKQEVTDKLNLSDKAVNKYWKKYEGTVHIAQILLQRVDLADSLYRILKNDPNRFEDFALQFSQDEATRENNGDLGFRRVIDIPIELRDPIFSLKDGMVSEPIHSTIGIHLVKRYERKVEDADQDEKTRRESYRMAYSMLQRQQLQVDFFERAQRTVSYELYWDSLQIIIDKAKQLREERFGLDEPLSFCIAPSYLTDEENNITIVQLDDFKYTAEQFLTELKNRHIRTGINFDIKPVIEREIMSFMMPRMMHYYGKATNKEDTPQFEHQYYHTKIGYVYQKYVKEQLLDTITVSKDELQDSYDHAIHNFFVPEEIKCSEIHLETEKEAKKIYNQLVNGASFEQLVKKTIRPGFAETNGNLGPCSPKRFSPIYEAAHGKKVGEYAGPVAFDGKWSVVRIDNITPDHYKPLSEVESSVRGLIMGRKKFNVFHNWVDAKKKEIEFFINEEMIKNNLKTGIITDES